jgi:hypothetical protein
MKNLFLIVLTLTVLTMFSTKRIHAENAFSLIEIVADHSGSMFDSGHIEIQSEAIITALSNYVVDCNTLHVDYIAWGNVALPAVSAQLTDQDTVDDYAIKLYNASTSKLSYTDHHVGLSAAIRKTRESKAQKKVVLFITDGVSEIQHNFDLGRIIPPDVTVFTISLGTQDVSNFVERNIQPKTGGQHFHADNADELVEVLEQAFEAAKIELCLS